MQYAFDSKSGRSAHHGRRLVAALMLAALLAFASGVGSAQTYNVIYNFTGGNDGANPSAGVTLDRAGNLYGTTAAGASSNCSYNGITGCGTVYELSHVRGGWSFMPIHQFTGTPDGGNPLARVVMGAGGALYGSTAQGGTQGLGTVFELLPPVHICTTPSCPWLENVLYSFQSTQAGSGPGPGDLVFDSQGNIYGTTIEGGGFLCDDGPCGTVYELTRSQGQWNEHDWNPFDGLAHAPFAGVVRDSSGNLYGTASATQGGIYEISQGAANLVFTFADAVAPIGGLTLGSSGQLYGTTSQGGSGGGGTVFQYGASLETLYSFSGPNEQGAGPTATLLMDAAGNLYGTTHIDGAHQQGSVFKLSQSNGVWTLSTLHDFTGLLDGGQPFGQLTMDGSGNIYGTTTVGGASLGRCYLGAGCGVVFEITP